MYILRWLKREGGDVAEENIKLFFSDHVREGANSFSFSRPCFGDRK